jgi:hypothetical protein
MRAATYYPTPARSRFKLQSGDFGSGSRALRLLSGCCFFFSSGKGTGKVKREINNNLEKFVE